MRLKIKDLNVGDVRTTTLVVKSATARETKAKKPYLTMELYDGTDTIGANYWDWAGKNIPPVNAILDVDAQVTEWQGKKQLKIDSMRNNTTCHLSEFMPSGGADVMQTYKDAYAMMSEVLDDDLRAIALAALEKLKDKWLTIPGAVGVHHAYTGGTLIHSYSVANIAESIASNIPEADVDLCIVGGFLHDIGKLFTYKMNGISIEMTSDGQLYEHIFMGAEFIGNFADNHVDVDNHFTARKLQLLRHIILSHHGTLEFGSPVFPQCLEAHIVHAADDIDSVAEQIRVATRKAPDNAQWTDRVYTLNNRAQLTPNYVSYVMQDFGEAVSG